MADLGWEMSRPKQTLLKALRRELPQGVSLLLAVSGGIDSMSMLHGSMLISKRKKLRLEVAHLDHGLRATSHVDADFVADQARAAGLPCHIKKALPPGRGENIEAWGRRERYIFFAEVRAERKLDWVVTAHTADDVAETLLMRLFSNKEPLGIEARDEQRRLLRPLLTVSRVQILEFAKAHKISYVEDETNLDLSLLRNRVRHVVMPLLRREFDARMEETLAERAAALGSDISFLYGLILEPIEEVAKNKFGSRVWLKLVRQKLKDLPYALRWRFAEKLMKPILGYNLGRSKSWALVDFFEGRTEGVQLPGRVYLRAKGGGIRLEGL